MPYYFMCHPRYVALFFFVPPDGQFPINLSKFRVEKDHAFLEQADIDSLIRRLNILNRCADIMEEIKSKVISFRITCAYMYKITSRSGQNSP